MTQQNIEKRLRAMSAHTPSPTLDLERLNSGVEKRGRLIRITKMISAAAAAIVLITGAVLITSAIARREVASTITLDSGANISLSINRDGEVVEISAADQRGVHALKGFSHSGDVDAVTAELITHLIHNGTLSEYDNTLLLTADSEDAEAEKALCQSLSESIRSAYAENGFSGALLSQIADEDRRSSQISTRYHISRGKAQLLRELIDADSTMSYRSLSRMSVNDLNLIADSIGLDYSGITESGESSSLRYLEEGEAVRIVIDRLNSSGADPEIHIRLDARDGELLYRLTVRDGKTVYTCNLVASSGEIITIIKRNPNNTEIIIDSKSSSATVDDKTSSYTPYTPQSGGNPGVTYTVPSSTEASDSAPVETPTQPLPETPTQPLPETPTSAPAQPAATSAKPVPTPTESDEKTERGEVPDFISFTSSEYYRRDCDLLAAGYNVSPWDEPPEGSYLMKNTEIFRGVRYDTAAVSGQQFLGGKLIFICNTAQLKNFLADYSHAYTDTAGKGFDTSKYTDSYFKTKSLVLTVYDLQNYNFDFSVMELRIDGDTLYVNATMTYPEYPEFLPDETYIAHNLTVYETDRAELQAVKQLKLY